MDDQPWAPQRIACLRPLGDVLACIDALVRPVPAASAPAAPGRILASNLTVAPEPPNAIALRDGWAIDSSVTLDASAHAPALLVGAVRVDAGEPLPPGADAVAPFDLVNLGAGGPESIAPVAPGEGVLAVGADTADAASEPVPLLQAGARLDTIALAVLDAIGVADVMIRAPRLRVLRARAQTDRWIDAATQMIARAVEVAGGIVLLDSASRAPLEDALQQGDFDAAFVIGGTGRGHEDASVTTLARLGRVEVHGIALAPGETAAFGMIGALPVLALPGRPDAALAVWLTAGQHLVRRLSGRAPEDTSRSAKLGRKIASNLGLAEVIPVYCRHSVAEPLASGYLPLRALAQANGWVLVPGESEGYPAGAEVMVRPWP